MGDNPERDGLKDTPKRVIKMFDEIFKGYDKKNEPILTKFNNNNDGICVKGIVTDSGYFYSQCEHHLLPFFGNYYFGIIYDKKILGLSKIARVNRLYRLLL